VRIDRHVGFLAGTIVRVGEYRGFVLHGVHGAVDVLAQFLLQCLQYLPEMSELLGAHVVLASLGLVRRKMLM